MKSNQGAPGLVIPVKTRSKATDKSSVNKDFKSPSGQAAAPMYAVRSGAGTSRGPAQVIQGVYTQPITGGGKN